MCLPVCRWFFLWFSQRFKPSMDAAHGQVSCWGYLRSPGRFRSGDSVFPPRKPWGMSPWIRMRWFHGGDSTNKQTFRLKSKVKTRRFHMISLDVWLISDDIWYLSWFIRIYKYRLTWVEGRFNNLSCIGGATPHHFLLIYPWGEKCQVVESSLASSTPPFSSDFLAGGAAVKSHQSQGFRLQPCNFNCSSSWNGPDVWVKLQSEWPSIWDLSRGALASGRPR